MLGSAGMSSNEPRWLRPLAMKCYILLCTLVSTFYTVPRWREAASDAPGNALLVGDGETNNNRGGPSSSPADADAGGEGGIMAWWAAFSSTLWFADAYLYASYVALALVCLAWYRTVTTHPGSPQRIGFSWEAWARQNPDLAPPGAAAAATGGGGAGLAADDQDGGDDRDTALGSAAGVGAGAGAGMGADVGASRQRGGGAGAGPQPATGTEYGRSCQKCHGPKPDRTHHCRRCGMCVLKMDHHCDITDTCIGFYNYKYYLSLLLWAGQVVLGVLVFQAGTAWDSLGFESLGDLAIVANYAASLLVFAVVFQLGWFHFTILLNNYTTIEFMEKNLPSMERGEAYYHHWDLNPKDNWIQVFGMNVLAWPFPIMPADGHQDPTRWPLSPLWRERQGRA